MQDKACLKSEKQSVSYLTIGHSHKNGEKALNPVLTQKTETCTNYTKFQTTFVKKTDACLVFFFLM